MDPNLFKRIRERAYQIWSGRGCPNGEAEQHWLTAESEILQSAKLAVPEPKKAAIPAKTSRKKINVVSRPLAKAAPAVVN